MQWPCKAWILAAWRHHESMLQRSGKEGEKLEKRGGTPRLITSRHDEFKAYMKPGPDKGACDTLCINHCHTASFVTAKRKDRRKATYCFVASDILTKKHDFVLANSLFVPAHDMFASVQEPRHRPSAISAPLALNLSSAFWQYVLQRSGMTEVRL